MGRERPGRRQAEGAITPQRIIENAVLVAFVLVVVATDWRWRRIPNAVTYPAMLAGLALGAWEGLPGTLFGEGLLDHAAGLALAMAVTYPVYAARGLKAGDVKLLMAVGALRGTTFLLYAGLFGALAGGVVALAFMAARRVSSSRPSLNALLHSWIPYGVALGAGVLVALVFERVA